MLVGVSYRNIILPSFTGNVDYHETQLFLTFPNGSTGGVRIPFSVPLIDDNIAEHQEHFLITASTSGNGIGIYPQTTYSQSAFISDDDRELSPFSTLCTGHVLSYCMRRTLRIVQYKQIAGKLHAHAHIRNPINYTVHVLTGNACLIWYPF